MKREITFYVGLQQITAFVMEGFWNFSPISSPLHKHHYAEIHLLLRGRMRYLIAGQYFDLEAGSMMLIPAGLFHEIIDYEPDTLNTAFQLTVHAEQVKKAVLRPEQMQIIFHEIEQYMLKKNDLKLTACLARICAEVVDADALVKPIQDPAFLIDVFFNFNYHLNVGLKDVARVLGRSEKQTARLIQRYTGHTFRQELTQRRMEAARHLMAANTMTLAEIAEKVGYQSYSGFWKAFSSFAGAGAEEYHAMDET